jgi:hypothetical protein
MIKIGSKVKFILFTFLNIARYITNMKKINLHIFIEKKILYRMQFIRTSLLLF